MNDFVVGFFAHERQAGFQHQAEKDTLLGEFHDGHRAPPEPSRPKPPRPAHRWQPPRFGHMPLHVPIHVHHHP